MNRGSFRRLTPAGSGPVAVLALAGDLMTLPLWRPDGHPAAWPAPGSFVLRRLGGPDRPLDVALVLRTGGDDAELHVHGGAGTVAGVMGWLRSHGLVEAGCPADAPTGWRATRAAASCRWGPLSELLQALRKAPQAARLRQAREALAREPFAARLRHPALVRLVGPPNAGKSSLFNALLGSERALVSPRAHTTRDPVRALCNLRGVAIAIEDTAGGEAPLDGAGADLVVAVVERPGRDPEVAGCPHVLGVLGRADLFPGASAPRRVSAASGEGLAELRDAMADRLGIPADEHADEWVAFEPRTRDELARLVAEAERASR